MPKPIPLVVRFWSRVDVQDLDQCWAWKGYSRDGRYGTVVDEDGVNRPAHRIAWELWHNASILPGYLARHVCDNPICCNPTHVILGTSADNTHDAIERNRFCVGDNHWTRKHPERVLRGAAHPAAQNPELRRGTKNGRAILTDDDVRQIRSLKASGVSPVVLAARYRISKNQIFKIARGEAWSHVPDQEAIVTPERFTDS
jgi:HNH endonuclease